MLPFEWDMIDGQTRSGAAEMGRGRLECGGGKRLRRRALFPSFRVLNIDLSICVCVGMMCCQSILGLTVYLSPVCTEILSMEREILRVESAHNGFGRYLFEIN